MTSSAIGFGTNSMSSDTRPDMTGFPMSMASTASPPYQLMVI